MDVKTVIHFAAKFEFWVFAITFLIAVCILSLKAAVFILLAVLDHSFPGWVVAALHAAEYLRQAF